MKLERIPLDRMEESVDTYQTQKSTWQSVNRKLTQFRDSARSLFGFETPFRDRIAKSSREDIVTASAERGMPRGTREIKVTQLASADRFLSASLDRDFEVPEGRYSFRIGGDEVSFSYSGGSLENFVNRLNDRGKDLIAARVVNDTADTQVLLIEGQKTGKENRIEFLEDSLNLGISTGLLDKSINAGFTFALDESGISGLTEGSRSELVAGGPGTLRFTPETEARLPITADISAAEGLVLEILYRVENLDDDYSTPQPPPGPDIAAPGKIQVDDIIIENEASKALTPPWTPPEPPRRNTDLDIFSLDGASGRKSLPSIESVGGSHTMRIALADYIQNPNALIIRNNNTHKVITIEEAQIFNPDARGDYRPANPIDRAGDAQISLDGITVSRSGNTIDDLIPGVTLNLHGTGDSPVEVSVEPDNESIKNGIINFVGYYNQLLTDIHVLTREDSSLIEQLEYLTDEEAEEYREKMGLFQGDITLNQLRTRLQRIMMDPYPGEDSGDVVLLHQIGISTNATGASTGIDANRLRGYLEINEEKLDRALESNIEEIKNLFGRDTDGDLVADSGVAVATDNYIRPYTQSGGILTVKMQSIDRQIDRTKDDIETLNDRLESKEAQLQRDYSQMEGALQSMEETSRALGNLNNSGQQ